MRVTNASEVESFFANCAFWTFAIYKIRRIQWIDF